MFRKFFIPALAAIGIAFGGYAAIRSARTAVPTPMVSDAPTPPYATFVAGAGLAEANTENIAIGTPIAGIVLRTYVGIGETVKRGDPLFTIDDRAVRAALTTQQAVAKVAEAQFDQANYELQIGADLVEKRVISKEDGDLRRYVAQTAAAQLALARAQCQATQTDLERLTVCAPVDGQVMQLKIHPGEFAQTGVLAQPLILLGNVEPLCVRVDVDENEAWRLGDGSAGAMAFLRGNKEISVLLKFVRFEPYVIPKVSLTGQATERVDTRVMQVVYSFVRGNLPIKVGQQMDVYINTAACKPGAPISVGAQGL
jgi:HlyD family secretion protein